MNNCWSQYRYSMDDAMLREKIFPLLRRSINLYLHLVREGDDGKLHLPTDHVVAAKLEAGVTVQVPPFIGEGDVIRVNTETGEYQARA